MLNKLTIVIGAVVALSSGCASNAHIARTEAEGEMLRFELAQTYVRKGAYDAALPLLQRSLREKPKNVAIRTLYATVLRERGLFPQAEKEFMASLAIQPRNPEAWAGLGMLLSLSGRPEEAERAHRKAIAIAPTSAKLWNNLGFSLFVADENDGAITAFEKALSLDPGLAVAYTNLGFAYAKRGSLVDAERTFRTVGGDTAAKKNMELARELYLEGK